MPPAGEADGVALVKSRLNLVEVVQRYVRLRRQGREWVGLCPFHEEKTPSFTVSEQKQSWFCFGCDEGGDLFTFVEKIEKTDFKGALERLAELAGVELPQASSGERERSRRRRALLEMNRLAAQYYAWVLGASPAGEEGRRLLRERGVDQQTSERFQLGYAPGGRNFAEYLKARSHSLAEARAAGLVRAAGQDFFSERVVIPIRDEAGRTVAFTGRAVRGDEPRKYVNSPESDVYVKGRILFGLDLARKGIEQKRHAVLMEGQFDVISAHRHGVDNALASSGTAFTEDQMRLLKRFTDEILIVFDSDPAGRRARYRVIELAAAQGMRSRVGIIPDGAKDPDEYLRSGGEWARVERESRPGWESWIRDSIGGLSPTRPQDFEVALRNVIGILMRIEDPAVRESYRRDAALWLGVDEHLVVLKGAPGGEPHRSQKAPAEARSGPEPDLAVASPKIAYLVQVLACRPEAAFRVRPLIDSSDLEPSERALLDPVARALEEGGEGELARRLEGFPPGLARLVRKAWAAPPPALDDAAVDDVASKIRAAAGQRRRLAIIRDLADAERRGDAAMVADLQARYVSQLDDRVS